MKTIALCVRNPVDTIEGMRAFLAVAKQSSFTSGAKQLGISTKLCSKYIGQLETRIEAQLFHRTTRSVSLTETGMAYLERCERLVSEFDELEGEVQQKQTELAGPIRLTAPTGFGSAELIAAIATFQKQHPKVTFDLSLSDHHQSLIEEGFELAIRFGGLKDSSLMARKLMDMRVVVFASPTYLQRHGEPETPNDLTRHNCLLQKTSADPDHWHFFVDGGDLTVSVDGSFRTNSPRAVANMAAKGLGIGIGPYYCVAPFLATGELQLLFEEHEKTELGLYALYPPSRHLTARIRAFIDHLVGEFQANEP